MLVADASAQPGTSAHGYRRLTVLVFALIFLASLLQSAIVPLLPRFAQLYHLSPTATALLLAAPSLATFAISAPAGLLADRIGARRVTLAAGGLLLASALAQGTPSMPIILAGRLAFGLAFGIIWTTGPAWLAQVQPHAASKRLGATVTTSAIGVTAGPALAGLLAERVSLGAPFLLAGAAAAAVTALLVATPQPAVERSASRGGSLRDLVRIAPRSPGVRACACAIAVSGAASSLTQLLVPLELHRAGISVSGIGAAFSVAALVYIVVSAVVVRLGRRAMTLHTSALATLVLALALAPAALSSTAGAVLATLMLVTIPRAAVGTIVYPLAIRHGATAELGDGAVIGLLNGVWAAAMLAAPFAAAAFSQALGPRAPYLAMMLVVAPAAGWLILAPWRESHPRALSSNAA